MNKRSTKLLQQLGLSACIALLAPLAYATQQQQVNVAVKIVEFQTTKGIDTGLSAYFKQRNDPRPYGRVSSGSGNVTTADLTFPITTNQGVTVFLDRIIGRYGEFELVLQGLVEQNRAFILSRPKAMVPVGEPIPTKVETVQEIPYENTVVVGATAVQTTNFRETGVSLEVVALEVVDDDGDPRTMDDIYIKLALTASVKELGQRITVALDDAVVDRTGPFTTASNAISVPEFISREIQTTIWVRHGQVLILGGLYRNTKSKNLATLPWITQGQDFFNSLIGRVLPFDGGNVPVTSALGSNRSSEGRRELVFIVKTELWRPSFTVASEFGFGDEDEVSQERKRLSPGDVITGVLGSISEVPQGIAAGLSGEQDKGVSSSLGGRVDGSEFE